MSALLPVHRGIPLVLGLVLASACKTEVGTPQCATGAGGVHVPGEIPRSLSFSSPADGSFLRASWLPVVVPVLLSERDAVATLCLDGEDVTDPLGLFRRRAGVVGGDWDYLGALDLVDVAAGEHRLTIAVQPPTGGVLGGESHFTFNRPEHRIDVEVVDALGQPTAARIAVTQRWGAVDLGLPGDGQADPYGRDEHMGSFFAVGGQGTVLLEPGRYRFIAIRGVRDHIDVQWVHVDGDETLRFTVGTAVEAPEYLAADLHVHTGRSYDSFVPDQARFESLMAAGLDVAVLTDHNQRTDPGPAIAWIEGLSDAGLRGIAGVEADIRAEGPSEGPGWDLGHLNAFPIEGVDVEPLPHFKPVTVGAYLDAFRARQVRVPDPVTGGAVLLQLNHPRGIHFRPEEDPVTGAWPLFSALGFDPAQPVGEGSNTWMTEAEAESGTTALDFDAVEVVNRFSLALYQEVRRDWFALLDAGHVITATGNSDSHALQVEVAGFPVNLVAAPRPGAAEPLDTLAFIEAIDAGHVLVTTGPVVELVVQGDGGSASMGELLQAAGTVTAKVRVRAAPWVPVHEVRLVVDGVVHALEPPPPTEEGQTLDTTFTWTVPVTGDHWIVAEAGWPVDGPGLPQPRTEGLYDLVAPGYVPIGFTNPVRIDGDGDGEWRPAGAR